MKIIDFNQISQLGIKPEDCVEWVNTVFQRKQEYILPAKISIKMPGEVFFNTMPSYLPDINRFGTKVVSRYPDRKPALLSNLLLYDAQDGNLLAVMDATWITAMRTGAVAALSIKTLQSSQAREYAFLGLGNTARATLLCLLSLCGNKILNVRLLSYKEQEFSFMERFKDFPNIRFTVYENAEAMISGADVIVSCVTVAAELFASDASFKPGVLVVPVHTRGFQNCDLFFDKVYADDKGHVDGFKYFDRFRQFDELSNVLLGKNAGRESDTERILSYNIGISLHDVYFASKVYDLLPQDGNDYFLNDINDKFWI